MEMIDSALIPRSRDAVWRALNDPDVLRRAVPGCETIEILPDGRMRADVTVRVGPVKARFSGEIAFENTVAPRGYTLVGEGKGGLAGFAKGSADVALEEISQEETLLRYHARVQVGGKLAQLGARLLDSTAKKLARQFFEDFGKIVAEYDRQLS